MCVSACTCDILSALVPQDVRANSAHAFVMLAFCYALSMWQFRERHLCRVWCASVCSFDRARTKVIACTLRQCCAHSNRGTTTQKWVCLRNEQHTSPGAELTPSGSVCGVPAENSATPEVDKHGGVYAYQ